MLFFMTESGSKRNPDYLISQREAVKRLEQQMTNINSSNQKLLIILYAGKSRFSKVVNEGIEYAKQGNKIILVACGCEEDAFDQLPEIEGIIAVMPHINHCDGARDIFGDIVTHLFTL